jgi:multiple sugar transport system substrate-binding protein
MVSRNAGSAFPNSGIPRMGEMSIVDMSNQCSELKLNQAPVELLGMTWDHPRGYDPLVACSELWLQHTNIRIRWQKRSLQDFESYPVEDLARKYDLIVIDHPHVGEITARGCLLPFAQPEREDDRKRLAAATVGPSYASYFWEGQQWALPIDAATQVQAWRPDLLDDPPATWEEVLRLADQGSVLCPLRPPHSLMSFFTMTANLGAPCDPQRPDFVNREIGARAYALLESLARRINERCFTMDPIAVLEEMSRADTRIACAPLIYGYVSYSLQGVRPARVHFTDMVVAGDRGPVGSALGGTGIAVSAFSRNKQQATAFAYWVASGPIQREPYAASGGQPGNAEAWSSAQVNAPVAEFYKNTRTTLDGAWLRPRHKGYIGFQHWAAERLTRAWASREPAAHIIPELNQAFRERL